MTKIGTLHPGEMGVSIAASAINNGHEVYWASDNRSDKTHLRAEKHNLIKVETLMQLCEFSEIIFSVCPPHAAEEVAKSVIETGFKGLYLDANAISPQRVVKIAQMMESASIHFVDGSIIGEPSSKPKATMLYLSGKYANAIANCFTNGPLEAKIIGDEIGKASALKMCYAAFSKGITALFAGILATAESLGVRDELYHKWDIDEPGFSDQANGRVNRVTAKAWRFEGEMHEIAVTFQGAGLPNGFHEAAADVYHRLAGFKDSPETPKLDEILEALLK